MISSSRTLRHAVLLSLIYIAQPYAHAESPPSSSPVNFSTHKALLIGVDGMQYEKLQEAIQQGMAPNIAQLSLAKSYTGGVNYTSTRQPTSSGPSWATVLTGSWINRHQTGANNGSLRYKAPSLFKQLKVADPQRRTASIISWDTINKNLADEIAQGYIDLPISCDGIDQCVTYKASHELEYGQSDLVLAHFNEPDNTGHDNGFTDNYQQAIQRVDAQVGQLLSALERRKESYPEEDWLVIVAPDHGRRLPTGKEHGQQTLSEKTTFIAMNKPGNLQLTAPVTDPVNSGFGGLYGFASQADITPTLLSHLGVKPDVGQHTMDGLPLTGALGVRQLTAQAESALAQVTLNWRTTDPSGGPLQIYRDGQAIATLTDQQNEYVDRDVKTADGTLNYTVVVNEVPVSRLVRVTN